MFRLAIPFRIFKKEGEKPWKPTTSTANFAPF